MPSSLTPTATRAACRAARSAAAVANPGAGDAAPDAPRATALRAPRPGAVLQAAGALRRPRRRHAGEDLDDGPPGSGGVQCPAAGLDHRALPCAGVVPGLASGAIRPASAPRAAVDPVRRRRDQDSARVADGNAPAGEDAARRRLSQGLAAARPPRPARRSHGAAGGRGPWMRSVPAARGRVGDPPNRRRRAVRAALRGRRPGRPRLPPAAG